MRPIIGNGAIPHINICRIMEAVGVIIDRILRNLAVSGASAVARGRLLSMVSSYSNPLNSGSAGSGKTGLWVTYHYTVKSQIIEQCAMPLELDPLVRSGVFFAFFAFLGLGGAEQLFFCSYFPHFTRQEILDCMAHCSIIRDFTVVLKNAPRSCVSRLKQGPGSEALGGWHLFIL